MMNKHLIGIVAIAVADDDLLNIYSMVLLVSFIPRQYFSRAHGCATGWAMVA